MLPVIIQNKIHSSDPEPEGGRAGAAGVRAFLELADLDIRSVRQMYTPREIRIPCLLRWTNVLLHWNVQTPYGLKLICVLVANLCFHDNDSTNI